MAASRELGVRLIVLYKAVKAVGEVALAVALVALAAGGELETVRQLARTLREHVASGWSLAAGRALMALLSPRGLHLVQLGLALDGLLSGVEGWSLWRGYTWAPWLVVLATASPLPLEVVELFRSLRATRTLALVLNVAVVVYLARRIARRAPHGAVAA